MIDIVLGVLFCYQLHRMATEKGLSPTPYILNYLAIFFFVIITFACIFSAVYGSNALIEEEGFKAAMMFQPFAILFEFFLFISLRKRIQKAKLKHDGEDDFTPPAPPDSKPPKKDLSYFR